MSHQAPSSSADQPSSGPSGMLAKIEALFKTNTDTDKLTSAKALLGSALTTLRAADGQNQKPFDSTQTPSAILAEIGGLISKFRADDKYEERYKDGVKTAAIFLRNAFLSLDGVENVDKKSFIEKSRARLSEAMTSVG